MKIHEFLNKWAPDEPEKDYEFQDDLRAALDTITGQHNITAIQALTDIKGAELVIDTVQDNYGGQGRVSFGPSGKSIDIGISVTYSLPIGLQEADWLLLLRCIAAQALTTMK